MSEPYDPLLDGDQYHVDDLIEVGRMDKSVRYIAINYQSAVNRNIADIRRNIELRKQRETEALTTVVE